MEQCKYAAQLRLQFIERRICRQCALISVFALGYGSVAVPDAALARDTLHTDEWQAVSTQSASGVASGDGWFRTAPNGPPQDLSSSSDSKAARDDASELAADVQASGSAPDSQVSELQDASQIIEMQTPPSRSQSAPSSQNELNAAQLRSSAAPSDEYLLNGAIAPATINIDLFLGEVQVLGEFDVRRVAVGNGSIVKAKVLDSGELLVIATAAGSTSLRLWNRDDSQIDYNIRVSETDPETRVRMQRMVRMRVRMVEFRKSALGSLGINWSDGASGPTLATAGDAIGNSLYRPAMEGFDGLPNTVAPFSTYLGIASSITSRINFLAQNGDAVTLAEPVLSAMNGGEASFLAGGEVPYPSVGENGQTQVEFKEYGVKLNVAPMIDSQGNVHTRLETEISQLDSSVTVQGAPGLLTRRAQTEVTVRSGETIVISGLLSSESSADTEMIPGLGRLPVIGRLFRSRNKRNSVSELVIFVTPEVVEPQQPMISERERDYLRESDKRAETLRRQLPLME